MINILSKIEQIARIIFENDSLIISETTSHDDIEEWDSLTHIQLISSLEDEFKIKFTFDEMLNNSTMGDITKSIMSK